MNALLFKIRSSVPLISCKYCKRLSIGNPANGCSEGDTDCMPNWIIDDLRFRNEYNRVKKYNGYTIYVKRGEDEIDHVEGQLSESDFDYVIDNNGDISDLIKEVKKVYERIN